MRLLQLASIKPRLCGHLSRVDSAVPQVLTGTATAASLQPSLVKRPRKGEDANRLAYRCRWRMLMGVDLQTL